MDKVPPDNLGKRQHDLNAKVNEAFISKRAFDTLKNELDNSEVDKFFKIDLAAKSRNVNYIIEILKTGVTLYAHRAIKQCPWLFTDEYSDIICPEYLSDKIFPETSMRVKRLILKTAAMRIRREDRVLAFFEYCIKINMTDIALKCLLFTSEKFKLDLLQNQNKPPYNTIVHKKRTYVRFIIGKSFAVLEAYMKMLPNNHDKEIRQFRYLYPVDNNRYLDLLEKYVKVEDNFSNSLITKEFDPKLCDDVMKKYKSRLLAKPIFYLNTIHNSILLRNITADDAKIIIAALLPSSAEEFWQSWFSHHQGKVYFPFISRNEIFVFLKTLFNDHYPEEEFEMHKSFYKQCYYQFMTVEQQEEWALKQIKSDRQVLGVGNDYLWYRFVNFEIAFEVIKNLVIVTKEAAKRADMCVTLIKSLRKDCELKILFEYYYKRHINELQPHKRLFIDEVITHQKVFEFDDACWEAFYKLLLSTDIYNDDGDRNYPQEYYKTVVLFYNILNKKDMPEKIFDFLRDHFYPRTDHSDMSITNLLEILNDEKRRFLFNYLHTFYTDKMSEYKNMPYTCDVHYKSERYLSVVIKLMYVFNVHTETAVQPKPQKQCKTRTINTNLSDKQLLRDLKKDKKLVIGQLPKLKARLENNSPVELNIFLKKIKIYFPTDITESMLSMFEEFILDKSEVELDSKSIESCIKGIFELGNEDTKINIMRKFVPENTKINFNEIDTRQLNIQRAVCRFASKSIPPVPLSDMLSYMQGDYVRDCLHLFGIYKAAFPPSKSITLVESVLSTPVSIQKHALRLAFQCLSAKNIKNISKNIWNKTKNVSLRSIIYKALFMRIEEKNESILFDVLISFTLDLHDDDEKDVFELVEKNTLPKDFLGRYKKATWQAISVFKDKEPNIGRKIKVIIGIKDYLSSIDEELVITIIEEHLKTMFDEQKLYLNYSREDIAALYVEKWKFIAEAIFNLSIDDSYSMKYIMLAQDIVMKCLKMWNENHSGKYIYQQCFWEYIEMLDAVSLEYSTHSEYLVPIYEGILDVLQATLPLHIIYSKKWKIQMIICNRRAIKAYRETFSIDEKCKVVEETALEFGKLLGKLVSDHVDTNTYFRSFSEQINDVIYKCVDDILSVIPETNVDIDKYKYIAVISVTLSLVEYEMLETYILALQLLPTICNEHWKDKYQIVMDKLMKFSHPEVQYVVHQKFLN